VEWCLVIQGRFDLPGLDTFIEQNLGAYSRPVTQPAVAFADFRRDPYKYPLKTPSGKIEIFSKTLYEMDQPEEIPAVPKYIPEGQKLSAAQDSELSRAGVSRPKLYPLHAIGHHSLARVHTTHANNDWLQEAFPQRIYINPLDAAARCIRDGDLVRVWNELGELVIQARLTMRILPGVVDIPQGAWWNPDENGHGSQGLYQCAHFPPLDPAGLQLDPTQHYGRD
jgi:anaerobic dimethyl sulfoxide reductase subunit A